MRLKIKATSKLKAQVRAMTAACNAVSGTQESPRRVMRKLRKLRFSYRGQCGHCFVGRVALDVVNEKGALFSFSGRFRTLEHDGWITIAPPLWGDKRRAQVYGVGRFPIPPALNGAIFR